MAGKKKETLDLDRLVVDSFETNPALDDVRGTVQAHEATPACEPHPCTCFASCLCQTNYYYCGTGHDTIYSCDFTANASCLTPA